jgi:hypothetical protein
MGEAPVRTVESLLTASDAIFHPTSPNVIFLGKNPRKTLESPIKSKRNQRKRDERWETEDENFTPTLPSA